MSKYTLVVGMIGISKGRGQGIIEYRHGFVERDAVLLDVRCGFVAVPLEAHRTILTCVVSPVRLTRAVTRRGQNESSHVSSEP